MSYCGHTVNFKTTKQSYKSHRKIAIPRENWKIFKHTHEAIVSEDDFEKVQEMRSHRRRNTKSGKLGLFQGLVFCADCGHKHYYNGHGTNDRYYCSGSVSRNIECDNVHSITESALKNIVLNDFKRVLAIAKSHEIELVGYLRKQSETENSRNLASDKKRLSVAEKRFSELDVIIRNLFESNVSGKISDERFAKMSADYETEQLALQAEIQLLQENLAKCDEQNQDIGRFMKLVKNTIEPRELTPTLIRELLERIELGRIFRENGRRTQKVKLFYRFVGEVAVNEEKKK